MSVRIKLPQAGPLPPEMVLWAGGSPRLAALFHNRGIDTREEIEHILSPLAQPEPDLRGYPPLTQAIVRVETALERGEKIAVYGDYDVDGITATALLVTALKRLQAEAVWHIPDRFSEGYGMDSSRVHALAAEGVNLIITCDCGISNHAEIQLAGRLGLDVVVTDHHTPPPELPQAAAVLNFKLLPPGHPSRDLPGVGTAFVLARELLSRHNWSADDLLDLVALGIIADVVPLLGHSRQLYVRGLPLLQQAERPGLAALFAAANLQPGMVDEEKLGFQIAPRLNAAGRLDSGSLGVELLLAKERAEAEPLARELNRLNLLRKELGEKILEYVDAEPGRPVVAYNPGWHQGVIGIAAGNICNRSQAPTILMTDGRDGNIVGSARSVEGIDIYKALTGCSQYLLKYGGHPAAAGFSLAPDNLESFIQAAQQTLAAEMEGWVQQELTVDLMVKAGDINLELVEELAAMAPCGQGIPRPLLYNQSLTVKSIRPAGPGYILTLGDRRRSFAAGLWQGGPAPEPGGSIGAVFTVAQDYYRGQQSVMAAIRAWWPGHERPLLLDKSYPYEDLRGLPWRQVLRQFPQAAVYREGIKWQEYPGFTRVSLEPASVLVLLTPPPSPAVLRQVLAMAEPDLVVLGFSPGERQDFLREFLGALKFILKQQGGVVPLAPLAAALAQTEETILAALRLLSESKIVDYELIEGKLVLGFGTESRLIGGPRRERLRLLLEEGAAFNKWLQTASLNEIKKIKA
ncbi:MAG: single-stranded-DNA-specific exonuclease RecJ [Eubacteriales bacterium]|nr:single-stranded-DNA-specific exonuclease RecJ [Eubacteriales bacterium]